MPTRFCLGSTLLVRAILLLCPGPTAAQQDSVTAVRAAIAPVLTRAAAAGFTGGVFVALGERIVLAEGYGIANRATGQRVTARTIVSHGSLTKQFTAAAILLLQDRGLLSVDDSISRVLRNVPPDKAGITLRHLLTHSAGLREDYSARDVDPVGREEYLRLILAGPLLAPPGSRYAYSNAGYSMLAAIVEMVSGQTYELFLREQLWLPLGLSSIGYLLPAWPPDAVPRGRFQGEDWGTIIGRGWAADGPHWVLRGNGGTQSTMEDLWRWTRALATGRVLSDSARKMLWTPWVREEPDGDSYYGFGWVIESQPDGSKRVWHDGGNGIFTNDLHYLTRSGLYVYVAGFDSEHRAQPLLAELVAAIRAALDATLTSPRATHSPSRGCGP